MPIKMGLFLNNAVTRGLDDTFLCLAMRRAGDVHATLQCKISQFKRLKTRVCFNTDPTRRRRNNASLVPLVNHPLLSVKDSSLNAFGIRVWFVQYNDTD